MPLNPHNNLITVVLHALPDGRKLPCSVSQSRKRTKTGDRSITLDRHPRCQVVRKVDRHVTAGFDDVTGSDDDVDSHGRTTLLSVTFYSHSIRINCHPRELHAARVLS